MFGTLTLERPEVWRWGGLLSMVMVSISFAALYTNNSFLFYGAIFIAASTSSIVGFAFSAICGAILFHLSDDAVHLVQIMIVCSIANQAAMTWAVRRDIDWRTLTMFLIGGFPGVATGIWFLLNAGHTDYLRVVGLTLVLYAIYMLFRKPITLVWQPKYMDVISGFFGGITGGAAATPGFPVSIWCSTKGWDKVRQRALFQPFILIVQIFGLTVLTFSNSGKGMVGFDPTILLYIPPSLLGTTLGLTVFNRLTDLQFARAVNILLLVSGLALVF